MPSEKPDEWTRGDSDTCGRCGDEIETAAPFELKLHSPDWWVERIGYYCEDCGRKIARGK